MASELAWNKIVSWSSWCLLLSSSFSARAFSLERAATFPDISLMVSLISPISSSLAMHSLRCSIADPISDMISLINALFSELGPVTTDVLMRWRSISSSLSSSTSLISLKLANLLTWAQKALRDFRTDLRWTHFFFRVSHWKVRPSHLDLASPSSCLAAFSWARSSFEVVMRRVSRSSWALRAPPRIWSSSLKDSSRF